MTWVWTKEEVLKEVRDQFARVRDRGKEMGHVLPFKVCYMLTCETCFSHYPAAFFAWWLGLRLLGGGFVGFVLAVMFTAACENQLLTYYGTERARKRFRENLAESVEKTLAGTHERR
jgi:hypothetical protein